MKSPVNPISPFWLATFVFVLLLITTANKNANTRTSKLSNGNELKLEVSDLPLQFTYTSSTIDKSHDKIEIAYHFNNPQLFTPSWKQGWTNCVQNNLKGLEKIDVDLVARLCLETTRRNSLQGFLDDEFYINNLSKDSEKVFHIILTVSKLMFEFTSIIIIALITLFSLPKVEEIPDEQEIGNTEKYAKLEKNINLIDKNCFILKEKLFGLESSTCNLELIINNHSGKINQLEEETSQIKTDNKMHSTKMEVLQHHLLDSCDLIKTLSDQLTVTKPLTNRLKMRVISNNFDTAPELKRKASRILSNPCKNESSQQNSNIVLSNTSNIKIKPVESNGSINTIITKESVGSSVSNNIKLPIPKKRKSIPSSNISKDIGIGIVPSSINMSLPAPAIDVLSVVGDKPTTNNSARRLKLGSNIFNLGTKEGVEEWKKHVRQTLEKPAFQKEVKKESNAYKVDCLQKQVSESPDISENIQSKSELLELMKDHDIKLVDEKGKPYRRVFVPGKGWMSARKIQEEVGVVST